MSGDACVIWKPSRTLSNSQRQNAIALSYRLYPYSSNFGSKQAIQHAGIPMGITKDTTGHFYQSGKDCYSKTTFPLKMQDSPSDLFMRVQNLKKVCLSRFKMPDSPKGDFVVAVYRQVDSEDFSENDSGRLRELAGFLPMLYQRLVASQLRLAIVKVNEILRPRCSNLKSAELPLANLCKELAVFFSSREISVFMCEGAPGVDEYRLYSSTLLRSEIPKHTYRADKNDGLTGYVLKTGKSVWFHDLHNFDPERPGHLERRLQIECRYPGVTWTDGRLLAGWQNKCLTWPRMN